MIDYPPGTRVSDDFPKEAPDCAIRLMPTDMATYEAICSECAAWCVWHRAGTRQHGQNGCVASRDPECPTEWLVIEAFDNGNRWG